MLSVGNENPLLCGAVGKLDIIKNNQGKSAITVATTETIRGFAPISAGPDPEFTSMAYRKALMGLDLIKE